MKAVILAGGLGSRLRPFTQVIPKPLLPIGESSVLEIQVLGLREAGIREIFIATNYMSEMVEAYLGNGSKYGVKIKFSKETKPLGTCGPLSLLKKDLAGEPFVMMNGDVLTTMNFNQLYEFGNQLQSDLTVVTKEIVRPFDFGKVITNGNYLVDLEEKPDFRLEVLAGIYFMKPAILDLIPDDTYYGIDSLIKHMFANKISVGRYMMNEYWLDIGQPGSYQAAQDHYSEHFAKLRETNSK